MGFHTAVAIPTGNTYGSMQPSPCREAGNAQRCLAFPGRGTNNQQKASRSPQARNRKSLFEIEQGQREADLNGILEQLGVEADHVANLAEPINQRIPVDM